MNQIIIIIISKNLKHINNIYNFAKNNSINLQDFRFILCSDIVNSMKDCLLKYFSIDTLITSFNLSNVPFSENVNKYKMTQSLIFSRKILKKLYPENCDLNIFISVSDKEIGLVPIHDILEEYPLTKILCNIENTD